jgi:hypothetical protein
VFTLPELLGAGLASATASTNVLSVTFDDTEDWCDTDGAAMLVYSSRGTNESINYFKGPYRLAGVIEGDSVSPPTSPESITGAFGFDADQRVHVKYNLTLDDGRYSSPLRFRVDAS